MSTTSANRDLAKIARELRASGIPVTVENVMAHCEVPCGAIERWLEERRDKGTDGENPTGVDDGFDPRASAAKAVMGEVFNVNFAFDSAASGEGGPAKKRKSLATGALLGLLFPPAAFAYAAPILEGTLATLVYLGLTVGVQRIPYLGEFVGMLFVLPLNIIGLFLGLAYAAVHGANGRRSPLFLGRGPRHD